jgi:ABC-type spermidine/putrescine transport system permease subunit I
MDLFWEIVIILTALMLVIFIPFAYSYYETDETKTFVSAQNRKMSLQFYREEDSESQFYIHSSLLLASVWLSSSLISYSITLISQFKKSRLQQLIYSYPAVHYMSSPLPQ